MTPSLLSLSRWLRVGALALITLLSACSAMSEGSAPGEGDTTGVTLTGIDHLPEHLSVQNFWVNGYNGAQAGTGASIMCCGIVPKRWRPGLKAHVEWNVTNWKERTGQTFKADVPIDRYDEIGRMFVHFLADGTVRITLANMSAHSPIYPGTREPIPRKQPWKTYPWPSEGDAKSLFE